MRRTKGPKCWGDGTPIATRLPFETWGAEPDDRWVRVMADTWADAVWDITGCLRNIDELPIPQAVMDRLEAWQGWYDREEQATDELVLENATHWDIDGFYDEGLEIAKALKAALPDWTVVYNDSRHGCRDGSPVIEYAIR